MPLKVDSVITLVNYFIIIANLGKDCFPQKSSARSTPDTAYHSKNYFFNVITLRIGKILFPISVCIKGVVNTIYLLRCALCIPA